MILCALSATGEDDFVFNPSLTGAYADIRKLRLAKAASVLRAEAAKPEVNGFVPYLQSYSDFFYFLISDNQKVYPGFGKRQDARLEQIAKLSPTSPYQRMMMAEMRLHSAFVKLKFGNRTGGCWDIVRANKLLEENRKLFPGFVPHLKAIGLLHVMIGSVPDEYQWVARMMGLKGDIKQGLAELRTVEHDGGLFALEAGVTSLLLSAYILQPDEEVISKLKQLPDREPDNLLFHFLSASILMKRGESESARVILDKVPTGEAYLSFPFLHYMKAEIDLQKGLYAKAKPGYELFIKKSQGSNFVKDSYFKIFLCIWLSRQQPRNDLLPRVLNSGSLNVEADKHAQSAAGRFQAGEIADEQRVLFEARYAFDGGFLSRAMTALRGLDEASFKLVQSKIEYNYRLGRVLQSRNKPNESITSLKRALELSVGHDFYYGPSAALQLGYIYKKDGQLQVAAEYFRKALAFRKHEYKNSIDNKARAGLTEMGMK